MKKSYLIILFLILKDLVFGQINIHKNITTEDGLVNGQVSAILQDSKGYIWFGTYDGVSKWDGNNFENIQTHNGMLSSAILDIKEGPDGKIYFANYQGGVVVYDNGKLDTLNENNGLLTNASTSIAVLNNNVILLCSYGNKINKLKNGTLSNWSEEVGFPNDKYYTVRDVYQEADGTLYFATQNGLIIYKNESFEILTKEDGLNNDLLFGIIGDGKGTIYISTYNGINKIVNGKILDLTKGTRFQDSFSNKIILTENGTMYAATAHGIVSEKNGILKEFLEENGLAYNHTFSVFEDLNGTIYFGTNGRGFNVYNPNEKIISFKKNNGLPNESIWSILKSSDGTLYLGSVNGLVIKKDNQSKVMTTKDGLSGNFVRVIKESKNRNILIGTTNGFSVFKNNTFNNYVFESDLDITQVYTILESKSGDIYLGTQTGVVIMRDGKEIKEESNNINSALDDGLQISLIYSISENDSGMLVFSSHSGLATYKDDKYIFFTTKNGLVDNSANTTHISSDGSIWVGTLKGVNIIRNGIVIDTIDVNDGLSNNSIADIEEDENGRIFIATYHGLNVLTNYGDSLQINQLYKKDGLIGDDFTHEGTFVDNEGNLWLGTLDGISKYNPNVEKVVSTPPNVYIIGLQLYNEDINLDNFLSNPILSYNQNFLKFIYNGINLSAPEKIKYSYRLSGIDGSWVITSSTIAPYTNLDDGKYTFEVKAKNEWGYWSKPKILSFTITPAWWETWWFYTIAALSIAGIIAFIASYRYRHLLAIEKVRTKISSDLHDNIGSGLTEISFLSEMVKSQTKENKIANKGLNNISDISKTLINDMRDIVWLVNPNNDTLKDLFLRLQDSYQEVLRFSNITLRIAGIDELTNLKLPMNYRQHIYLMFKEAINNSIKYSESKNITLNVSTSSSNLVIELNDDGTGFDKDIIKKGNGLKNIKDRAKQVNGEISIISKVDEGTKIIFVGKFSKLNVLEI